MRADGHALADLEAGDGLLRLGDHGFWPAILVRSPTALSMTFLSDTASTRHVERDLVRARHLHDRLVAELLDQLGDDLFAVHLLQAGASAALSLLSLILCHG
jgi:hypothetical protein